MFFAINQKSNIFCSDFELDHFLVEELQLRNPDEVFVSPIANEEELHQSLGQDLVLGLEHRALPQIPTYIVSGLVFESGLDELLQEIVAGKVLLKSPVQELLIALGFLLGFFIGLNEVVEEQRPDRRIKGLGVFEVGLEERLLDDVVGVGVEIGLLLSFEVILEQDIEIGLVFLRGENLLLGERRNFGLAEFLEGRLLEIGKELGGVGVGELVGLGRIDSLGGGFERRGVLLGLFGEVQLLPFKIRIHEL